MYRNATSSGSPVMETDNHWMVAYFLLRGGRIINIFPGGFVMFCLDNTDGIAYRLNLEFFDGSGQISAKRYASTLRFLRKQMNLVQSGGEFNPAEFRRSEA